DSRIPIATSLKACMGSLPRRVCGIVRVAKTRSAVKKALNVRVGWPPADTGARRRARTSTENRRTLRGNALTAHTFSFANRHGGVDGEISLSRTPFCGELH